MAYAVRDFFCPAEMKLLYIAIDRARTILSADNATAIKSPHAAYVLAKGALMAAAAGEMDLSRLSAAACEHWAAMTADRTRVASYALH